MIWRVPERIYPEASYTLGILFEEWGGIHTQIEPWSSDDIQLERFGCRPIRFVDSFPSGEPEHWIRDLKKHPPKVGFIEFGFNNQTLSLAYFDHNLRAKPAVTLDSDEILVSGPVLMLAFALLTQLELNWNAVRDEHGLLPARSSFMSLEQYRRPLINEQLEILWKLFQLDQPHLMRATRKFELNFTSDIDLLSSVQGISALQFAKSISGDVLKRRDVRLAAKRLCAGASYLITRRIEKDPYNTFNEMMTVAETNSIQGTFFFKAGATASAYDRPYSLNSEYAKRLFQMITDRGHRIGIHPSYQTSENFFALESEVGMIKASLNRINQPNVKPLSGRQHYLRIQVPRTWRDYEALGLSEDQSIGFNEISSFRAGTCYPYRVYDTVKRERLNLVEVPLIAMDSSIRDVQGRPWIDVNTEFTEFAKTVKRYNGVFSFVWHNSTSITAQGRKCFASLLSSLSTL